MTDTKIYPVGARVVIRDAEWRITEVDMTQRAGYRLKCVGLSDLVRGKVGIFFENYEKEIKLLLPEETRLVEDVSPGFQKSKLYLESLFRSAPKTDPTKLEVSFKAAMDPMPYQFDPALQALKQPRARILIADAVGIGKTLEAGILTSELMARGRGRRILVIATKSVVNQFQQEFWNRFSIPLVRLDSAGIQRVRNKIPVNHNPFLYFDKSIVSVDTLKGDSSYLHYLSKAYWDIIIIDEAHNVAQRGVRSQRAKLAQILSNRSDTMIMLTATPHDGRSESFASLLNILDPTAIVDPKNYKVSDFADKGLVIRRFKSDVRNQVNKEFPDREIDVIEISGTKEENAVFKKLATFTQSTDRKHTGMGAQLFATTLTKAFFSSPQACSSVIENRVKKLKQKKKDTATAKDIKSLNALKKLVDNVGPKAFAKLSRLVSMITEGEHSIGWKPTDPEDRLVVFTESVKTLDLLCEQLPKLSGLDSEIFARLDGGMSETEIAAVVNNFNRRDADIRILLCSDVASEGINLHHLAHRMIHFDIPWSLLTFQQRNGRIDRYGQTKVPQIWYLQTIGDEDESQGDAHVLAALARKDAEAQKNLSDPAEFSLSKEEQEARTEDEIEGRHHEEVKDEVFGSDFDLDSLMEEAEETTGNVKKTSPIAHVLTKREYTAALAHRESLYSGEMNYASAVLRWMNQNGIFRQDPVDLSNSHRLLVPVTPELEARLKYLPAEVLPENRRFDLTDDVAAVQREMQRVRTTGEEWPKQTLLWPLHPVMKWLEDYGVGLFGRHTAPVLRLPAMPIGERWALLQGGYPNRRGYIPIHNWIAVRETNGVSEKRTLQELISALKLKEMLSNTAYEKKESDVGNDFESFIAAAVQIANKDLEERRSEYEATAMQELHKRIEELKKLQLKHEGHQLKLFSENGKGVRLNSAKEEKQRQIREHFEGAKAYITNTATTEEKAYLQLVAVFTGLRTKGEE
jgi:superfamily II DNA or RNA helicase